MSAEAAGGSGGGSRDGGRSRPWPGGDGGRRGRRPRPPARAGGRRGGYAGSRHAVGLTEDDLEAELEETEIEAEVDIAEGGSTQL